MIRRTENIRRRTNRKLAPSMKFFGGRLETEVARQITLDDVQGFGVRYPRSSS